jgi:glycosyltransferase involved in cell wall biosynthesis
MSDNFLETSNEVELDAQIKILSDDLEVHLTNLSLPDRGLVIAYNFAPFSDASAATVAKRIRQLGRKVDVVSQDMSAVRQRDEDLNDLVTEFVDQHFKLKGEPGFAAWPFIRDYVVDGYAAAKSSLMSHKYGFIYSRSMFPATHFLAAFIKSRHPEVFWISEFSDPVRHDVEGNIRVSQEVPDDYVSKTIHTGFRGSVRKLLRQDKSVFAWCEMLGIITADRVIFTNDHQREVMLAPYLERDASRELLQKTVVSPHPTLSVEFYNRNRAKNFTSDPGCIDIGYFGEFYPNRGVGELVRAVNELPSGVRRKFRVHIYTNSVEKARHSLQKVGFDTSYVRIKPSENLFSFLQLSSKMDALYVSDVVPGLGYSDNPYLPSKFSDYRGAGVPIIASVWPGSVLSRSTVAKKFLLGDVTRLSNFLLEFCRAKSTVMR